MEIFEFFDKLALSKANQKMLNSYHIVKKIYSLSRQGEACKDKNDAGKTRCSVSLRGVRHRTLLACAEANSAQCWPVGSLTPCSVSQFWIFENFSKNQHVGPSVSEIFIF